MQVCGTGVETFLSRLHRPMEISDIVLLLFKNRVSTSPCLYSAKVMLCSPVFLSPRSEELAFGATFYSSRKFFCIEKKKKNTTILSHTKREEKKQVNIVCDFGIGILATLLIPEFNYLCWT